MRIATYLLLLLLAIGASLASQQKSAQQAASLQSINNSQDPQTLTESVILRDKSWCRTGCTGLLTWEQQIRDGLLRGALTIAYHYTPEWRQFARVASAKGTQVVFATLPNSINGQYDASKNEVRISDRLRNEPSSVMAAIVAHEIVHAASRPLFTTEAAECFNNEIVAFSWEANVWQRVKQGFETTPTAAGENALVAMWQQRRLQEFVLKSPIYQEGCFGKKLIN